VFSVCAQRNYHQGTWRSRAIIWKGDPVESGTHEVLRRIDAARDIMDIVATSGNKAHLNADSLLPNLLSDDDEMFEKTVQEALVLVKCQQLTMRVDVVNN
jgi:hypothetical protein